MCGGVNAHIHEDLAKALESYRGPKTRIFSLRRHWGTKSKHETGKAVDLELCPYVIEYLVSEEGQQWLKDHGMTFYIEGKPGCKEVARYLQDPKCNCFVFFNPHATGAHLHLNV